MTAVLAVTLVVLLGGGCAVVAWVALRGERRGGRDAERAEQLRASVDELQRRSARRAKAPLRGKALVARLRKLAKREDGQ